MTLQLGLSSLVSFASGKNSPPKVELSLPQNLPEMRPDQLRFFGVARALKDSQENPQRWPVAAIPIGASRQAATGTGRQAATGAGRQTATGTGRQAATGAGRHAATRTGRQATTGAGRHAATGTRRHPTIGTGRHATSGARGHATTRACGHIPCPSSQWAVREYVCCREAEQENSNSGAFQINDSKVALNAATLVRLSDTVNPSPCWDFFRSHDQPQLLAQGPRHGAPSGVRLMPMSA